MEMESEGKLLSLQRLLLEVDTFSASTFKAILSEEINSEYLSTVQQSQLKECDPHDMKWLTGRASGIVYVLSLMNSMKSRTKEGIAQLENEVEDNV